MIGYEETRERSATLAAGAEDAPLRVAVADDHRVFANALARVLGVQTGVEVVGTAYDGEQAVELCLETRPDVILMDVTMPGRGGLSATREIRRLCPRTRVLILTVHADAGFISRGIEAGVQGYMLKDSAPGEILAALRAVQAGQTVLPP